MITFLIRRLLFMVVTVVFISMISFVLIELPPGSALDAKLQQFRSRGLNVTSDVVKSLEERYGINDPIYTKYWKWISRAVYGDFGQSFYLDQPVSGLIGSRIWFSIGMSTAALLFAWLVAIPVGVYSATHRNSLPDYLITVMQFLGVAIPEFLLAIVLMFVASWYFGVEVGVLYSKAYRDAPWGVGKLLDLLSHLWLPVVVIGTHSTAWLTRVMRANLLDVMGAQYVQTARSKGLGERAVVWKHAVRNALHPLVMALGATLPALISGEVIVSIVLNLPTTGPLYVQALINKDMYLAITFLLFLSILLVVGNLLADLALAWLDPRVRLE
ncbi:ABC transporter permease [Chloroflexota bacterium]|nr:ABC transporter permease [Chloroflexota bacterium]